MSTQIKVQDLGIRYQMLEAVRGISFTLEPGTSTALIGENGAGKTSTLKALAGCLPGDAQVTGTVETEGARIAIVPEREKIFTLLSVNENLTAADRQRGQGRVRIDDVLGWFPRLAERRSSLAGNLSGGEQQMLAVSMALMNSPDVLLLDEPTLGLAVPVIERMCETLSALSRELDLTVLCAEAETLWIDRLSTRALVLVRGALVAAPELGSQTTRDEIRALMLGL